MAAVSRFRAALPLLLLLLCLGCHQERAAAPAAASVDENKPQDGGTIVRRLEADVSTLNPILLTTTYDHVGVLYVGFVDWLRRRLLADGIERAFFIARDGWIIHQVYERMRAAAGGPEGAYLYGSQRALNIPAITGLDGKALDFLTSGSSRMTVAQFLGRLGLSADEHRAAIADAGFDGADQQLRPGSDFYLLRRLYQRWSRLGVERGKPGGTVAVACARELSCFLWEAAMID